MLDPVRRSIVEQQTGNIRSRVVTGRIGGRLGGRNHTEIDVGIDQALLVRGQRCAKAGAVGPVNYSIAATRMEQLMLIRRVA